MIGFLTLVCTCYTGVCRETFVLSHLVSNSVYTSFCTMNLKHLIEKNAASRFFLFFFVVKSACQMWLIILLMNSYFSTMLIVTLRVKINHSNTELRRVMVAYEDSSLNMQKGNDVEHKNIQGGGHVLTLVRHVSQMWQKEEKCLFCGSLII